MLDGLRGRPHGPRALSRSTMWLISVAAIVAACSVVTSPSPTADAVDITLLEWQPARAQVTDDLIDGFSADMAARGHPVRVRLDHMDLADAEFRALISERYRAGRPPDVTSYPTAWVPDFADQGHLADLTGRVAAWPDWEDHVYEVLRERARDENGQTWAVPRGATVIQLFYRRDVLEAFGVSTEQPRSWDQLVARMEELRDAMDRPPILIPAGAAWGGGTFDEGFINLMLGTDSSLYDVESGRWIVRSPGLDAVFALYERLTVDRLLPVAPLLEPNPWEPTKYQTFVDGDLAVVTQGTWGWTFDWGPLGRRPIDDLPDRVATWAFPTQREGDPFVWAAESWGWTVSAASAHPDEAWELIRWLSTGPALAADLTAVGNLSPRDDIRGVSPYADQAPLIAEEPLLGIGRSFRPQVGIQDVQDAVAEVTEGIITEQLTATQASDRFAELVTERLGADAVSTEPGP